MVDSGSDFDLDFRPRVLVPWLTRAQREDERRHIDAIERGDVICCPPMTKAEVMGLRSRGKRTHWPVLVAAFAAEPSWTATPCRGFLRASRTRGRRVRIEDTRNTKKGVESFGFTTVPRIPSMREMVVVVDSALNRPGDQYGPAFPTWQETVLRLYRRFPGEWDFWVRSLNYPQLEEWYRRQWESLGIGSPAGRPT